MSAERRLDRLGGLLTEQGLDALIVTGAANLYYLTGYSGSNGAVLVGPGADALFLTDFRYATQAEEQVDSQFGRQTVSGDLLLALAPELPKGRVGFDDAELSVRRHARLAEHLAAPTQLVGAGGLIERLRMVKDPEELRRIRAAAAIVDEVLGWLTDYGLAGRTERELAAEIERELSRRGADGPSFPPIVASGAHGALPHATPRAEPIERGTLVTVDLGARLDGYCSDCTRTFAVATEPQAAAREIYSLVLAAQAAGVAAVRSGPTGAEVDAVARAVIDAAGHGEHFGHGLGHGVGIEVHEAPRLSREGGDEALCAGNVVTIEPGVYLPGELGVRIEDLLAVTETGCEVLSSFTKELLVVD